MSLLKNIVVGLDVKTDDKAKKKLDYEDVFCVACRCIYIRPVTMPCNHTLCLECFKKMVDITSYQCPICRRRISNWLRKYKHDWDSVVNEELWEKVQQQFPVEVQKKLNDEDDGIDVIFGKSFARVEIEKGEVKKELDSMMINSELEREKIELQSLEVAKRLQEEEETLRKTQKLLNEKIMLEDAKLALIIQENVNQTLQEEEILSNESDKGLAKQEQRKLPKKGPLDMYTKVSKEPREQYESVENYVPSCSKSSNSSSLSCSSENSFLKSSINSSATTSIPDEVKDNVLDACTCGRLLDMNSNRPPCQFCTDQMTILDKLTTQQKNDYLMAKNLENSWRMQNFEEYNLRKRTNPCPSSGRKKVMKLSKGQLTLKNYTKELNKNNL